MLRLLHRPGLVALVLLVFVAGFTFYVTNIRVRQGSPPTKEVLWPGTKEWAEAQLAGLTLEQKIAQLFSTRAYSHYTSVDDPHYRRLVDLVERFEIGGLTFFQGDPLEQVTLLNSLQRRARLPLLVGQDMEWGAGMRIERTTTLPRTMALGATRDPKLAAAAGRVTAVEARALGTHLVFAPVADVNNNPGNPIINVRSFGEDPALVSELSTAFTRGLQGAGAISTAKHFPGHGDTETDSHADLPILPFDLPRLNRLELQPFRALVNEGVMAIMTGHLAIPAVEPDSTVPASLSPALTRKLLREDLGFDGLIVTDALDMRGVTKHFGTGEAAVRALEAGADVLLLSEDPYGARNAILQAIATGRLTEERIDESVLRVLMAKAWLRLQEERLVDVDEVRRHVGTHEHQAVGHTIARASLTLLRNEGDLLPLLGGTGRLLVLTLSDAEDPGAGDYFAEQLREQADGWAIDQLLLDARSEQDEYDAALARAASYDAIVVPAFVYVREWTGRINLSDRHQAFLNALAATDRPVVLVSFGNPYISLGLSPEPDAYVAAYGASPASQQAVAEALFGRSGFHGKLPITIPGQYGFGAGIDVELVRLRRGYPAEAGMDGGTLRRVDSLLHAAISERAFPGAAVAVGRGDVLVKLEGYGHHTYASDRTVTPASVFDLASLTKVIATTTAAMKLYEEQRLALDAPVARYLPAFALGGKERVTIRQLLTHTAGLPPFRPFHTMGLTRREDVLEYILSVEPEYTPGTESRYSDFGMIVLMLVVEQITGQDFATYAREEIFEPLGMRNTGFRRAGTPDSLVVPTEVDRAFRHRLLQGEVHDETAWILGGTSGHAGLFSTAEDLARFAHMLVNEGEVDGQAFLEPATIRLFTTAADPVRHTRALGWDTRSREGYSSAGQYFGPRSFGHTGFTGTSLWIDPDQRLFVILLTNRVYPTRENRGVIPVRAELADIAYQSIREDAAPTLLGVP